MRGERSKKKLKIFKTAFIAYIYTTTVYYIIKLFERVFNRNRHTTSVQKWLDQVCTVRMMIRVLGYEFGSDVLDLSPGIDVKLEFHLKQDILFEKLKQDPTTVIMGNK